MPNLQPQQQQRLTYFLETNHQHDQTKSLPIANASTKSNQNNKRIAKEKLPIVTPWKRARPLSLSTFVGHNATRHTTTSRFGTCPLCNASIPCHRLEIHAASCMGIDSVHTLSSSPEKETNLTLTCPQRTTKNVKVPKLPALPTEASLPSLPISNHKRPITITATPQWIQPTSQPMPGLYQFENFITQEEELQLLQMLDDETAADYHPWEVSKFNGKHIGKRWGVHCQLRERRVLVNGHMDQELPKTLQDIVFQKFSQLECLTSRFFLPNEANAIDYRRRNGCWLKDHVDDRKLSKEPIANLSLAGDCIMRFQRQEHRQRQRQPSPPPSLSLQQSTHNDNGSGLGQQEYRVFLPRRSLQVLTGPARYDYTHGITNQDLLSDRRVSITMRQSPITTHSLIKGNTTSSTRRIDELFSKSNNLEGKEVKE